MKKKSRLICGIATVFLILGLVGWTNHRQKYPYGWTHRCSKVLAGEIQAFPSDHEGKFPFSSKPGAVGLSGLLEKDPDLLELVVGKAGDLDEARRFFDANGYLTSDHTSWHYVEGLTVADKERALAWDKIPLGHNGRRLASNPREVIMASGMVRQVTEDRWDDFLKNQRRLSGEAGE